MRKWSKQEKWLVFFTVQCLMIRRRMCVLSMCVQPHMQAVSFDQCLQTAATELLSVQTFRGPSHGLLAPSNKPAAACSLWPLNGWAVIYLFGSALHSLSFSGPSLWKNMGRQLMGGECRVSQVESTNCCNSADIYKESSSALDICERNKNLG